MCEHCEKSHAVGCDGCDGRGCSMCGACTCTPTKGGDVSVSVTLSKWASVTGNGTAVAQTTAPLIAVDSHGNLCRYPSFERLPGQPNYAQLRAYNDPTRTAVVMNGDEVTFVVRGMFDAKMPWTLDLIEIERVVAVQRWLPKPPRLYLIRGLPGSGKSTHAARLGVLVVAADDWFDRGGRYQFDSTQLAPAHQDCQRRAGEALARGESCAVANTFSQAWEWEPYFQIAAKYGVEVVGIDLFDAGLSDVELAARNVHGVPVTAIAAMRQRWQHG